MRWQPVDPRTFQEPQRSLFGNGEHPAGFLKELRFVDEADVSTCHKNKRWSHLVLARQTELCSVNVTVDSKVTFENGAIK